MPFNLGAGELILIAAVALLLFGPRRLPEIGKAMGDGISSFKKAMNAMVEVPPPAEAVSRVLEAPKPQVPQAVATAAPPATQATEEPPESAS